MTALKITVGQLIDQLERDLPNADAVARVGEARQRARELGELGDQLVDHFIQAARRGGASWSQIGDAMGVSKQAAQQRASAAGGRFAKFTPRARAAVSSAQALAGDRHNVAVEPDHLAVIVLAGDGLAPKVVQAHGADPVALAESIRTSLPGSAGSDATVPAPFSPALVEVLELTVRSAADLDNNYVGTEHMLLGLLQMPQTSAARVLAEAGLDHSATRELIAAALAGYRHQGSAGAAGPGETGG